MNRTHLLTALFIAIQIAAYSDRPQRDMVGPDIRGGYLLPTLQSILPAGTIVTFPGRPVDMALDAAHNRLFVKEARSLVVIDTQTRSVAGTLPYPAGDGASMHGIAVSSQGARVWISTAGRSILEAKVGVGGKLSWERTLFVQDAGNADCCGIALCADETRMAVCCSIANNIAVLNLQTGMVDKRIPVGIAPYDIAIAHDGRVAYVSDWGGSQPGPAERSAPSAGTPTRVDARGIALDGSVSFIDITSGIELDRLRTGLHPSALALTSDGGTLCVANANSDTVTVIDTRKRRPVETINLRADSAALPGSAPNALAFGSGGLLVAEGGANCVAAVTLRSGPNGRSRIAGLIPTGWYPAAVVSGKGAIYTACIKGVGARWPGGGAGWNVSQTLGAVSITAMPDAVALREYTAQAVADARIIRDAAHTDHEEIPVPVANGGRSIFKHVVYIIKENRTYDQLFGDIRAGNGDTRLVMYGNAITPNHHAIAAEFGLLDNYYCNGSISADGHSWATEGNCTDHLEKSFGGFSRSYTFGDDPLTYSSSGFIWDRVLAAGLTFRNFGEMDYAEPVPRSLSYQQIYSDFTAGAHTVRFTHSIGIANLKRHTDPEYPGWNLSIPDVVRADIFVRNLKRAGGKLSALTIIYLPNDHTSGTSPGAPTPKAQVADNDLALGRIVEALSHAPTWPTTCIFVNEDDPQDGYDHVDGHRSICLVVSPYSRRHAVISTAYNQTSVLHTIERILGVTPMTIFDAGSPVMDSCFTTTPDYNPYICLPNTIPLDKLNPPAAKLRGAYRRGAIQSSRMDWSRPDAADDEVLGEILRQDGRNSTSH